MAARSQAPLRRVSLGDPQRLGDCVQGLGIDAVLLMENPLRQGLGVIARKYRHMRLSNDRSSVKLRSNKVNGATVLGAPLGDRPFMGMQTTQVRQQRGVNIQQSSVPSLDERRAQNPHEPGEANDLRAGFGKPQAERSFERGLIRITREVDCFRRDAGLARARKTGAPGWSDSTSTISAEKLGDRAASIKALMFEPRPEIRMTVRTRKLTTSAFHGSRRTGRLRTLAGQSKPATDRPGQAPPLPHPRVPRRRRQPSRSRN